MFFVEVQDDILDSKFHVFYTRLYQPRNWKIVKQLHANILVILRNVSCLPSWIVVMDLLASEPHNGKHILNFRLPFSTMWHLWFGNTMYIEPCCFSIIAYFTCPDHFNKLASLGILESCLLCSWPANLKGSKFFFFVSKQVSIKYWLCQTLWYLNFMLNLLVNVWYAWAAFSKFIWFIIQFHV